MKHLHVVLKDEDYKVVADLAHKMNISKAKALAIIIQEYKPRVEHPLN